MFRANLVYLTYNSEADVPFLASLVSSAGEELPVIAIDNASGDDSVSRVCDLGPAVVRNETNLGFTAAINQGLRRCDGEWAIIINPDVRVLESNWLPRLLDVEDEVGIVGARLTNGIHVMGGGVVEPFESPMIRQCARPAPGGELLCDELLGWTRVTQIWGGLADFTRARDVAWVAFAVVALRMSMVRDIGLLDETYWHYVSDHEYCLRAWSHGWSVRYQPVAFWHHGNTAIVSAPSQVLEAAKNDIRQWCRIERQYLRSSAWV